MKASVKQTATYGSWPSPITADMVASATPTIDLPSLDQGAGPRHLYWLESRPDESGRNTIVCQHNDGSLRDILPSPYSARSQVHEYGGACYIVVDSILYFVAQHDQRIYRLDLNQTNVLSNPTPQPLTPDNQGYRFADFCFDPAHRRLLCVCEQHFEQSPDEPHREPRNFIAAVALDTCLEVVELVSGADFYAYPRISPSGTQLCWVSWNHPSMPWYGSELWQGTMDDSGRVSNLEHIAGNANEAIFQPQWSNTGQLYFVSDRSQWWNLYRYEGNSGDTNTNSEKITKALTKERTKGITPICPMDAEFATPLWTLGMSAYTIIEDAGNVRNDTNKARIACCYSQNGLWHLGLIDTASRQLTTIETPYTQISAVTGSENHIWFVAASPDTANQLIRFDINTSEYSAINQPAKSATLAALNKDMIARAELLSFATSDDDQAHAFYYAPCNAGYQAPAEDKPPLIVICHGGPTGASSNSLNLKIQFWTSRGFAVLDINYRGSTGYGRSYCELLDGQWGISDVEDVVAGAQYIVEQSLADPDQLAIRGSSAGGYTVLAALTFHTLFKAGASHYGIGDLETLARDTHKFESQYLERLVGPYPEQVELYQARSPIKHIDQLTCPVIFFQGLDDKVVPPDQAEAMVAALTRQDLPCDYIAFEGEGHGFRKPENVAYALNRELQFYSKVFSFDLPELELSEDSA